MLCASGLVTGRWKTWEGRRTLPFVASDTAGRDKQHPRSRERTTQRSFLIFSGFPTRNVSARSELVIFLVLVTLGEDDHDLTIQKRLKIRVRVDIVGFCCSRARNMVVNNLCDSYLGGEDGDFERGVVPCLNTDE